MKIAEAIKTVLKDKTHLFTDYWKEDVLFIVNELKDDLHDMVKSGKNSWHKIRKEGLHLNLRETLDSVADSLLIFKLLPGRIKEGVYYFKDDFLFELDGQEDPKKKTLFSLKVIGALSTYSVTTIYQIKKGKSDFQLPGLRRKNALTNFIVAELLLRLSRLFIQRFLTELERTVTEEEDLKHIRYFRQLLSDREATPDEDIVYEDNDRAIEIVDALKHFILTGSRFD